MPYVMITVSNVRPSICSLLKNLFNQIWTPYINRLTTMTQITELLTEPNSIVRIGFHSLVAAQ